LAIQQTVKDGKKKAMSSVATGPKFKKLNLETYKYHALGDYPNMIRRMGTTDNFSTQPVFISFRKERFYMLTHIGRANWSIGL
jgi:hypothetical protein